MLRKQGLDFLGGVETLIPKDAKILLKPNLLKKAEVEKAVITHPVVVGAFAGILRESGYENIVLADSCGHGTTQAVIRGTGMDTYLEKYHIPAVDYSEGVKTAYPQGVQAKEFILPKELLEQDCVISLSKMKTHALERITGAVKNSYGFVYGFHKVARLDIAWVPEFESMGILAALDQEMADFDDVAATLQYFQPAWFPSSPHKNGRLRSAGFCRCHAQMSSSA